MSTTASHTPPRLASLADAAAALNVHPRTLRRRIADGSLTGYRLGPRLLRVDLDELEAMLRPIPNARTTTDRRR